MVSWLHSEPGWPSTRQLSRRIAHAAARRRASTWSTWRRLCSCARIKRCAARAHAAILAQASHFCVSSCRFSFAQCPWPLDVADDVDELCVSAADPRVCRQLATNEGGALQPLPPPAAVQQDSSNSASDELQHISNMLFQPSPAITPACSPSMHGVGVWHLPSGDSLPPSTMLGPTVAAMPSLPPAFELGAADETGRGFPVPPMLRPAATQASADIHSDPSSPKLFSPMPPPEMPLAAPSPLRAASTTMAVARAAAPAAAPAASLGSAAALPGRMEPPPKPPSLLPPAKRGPPPSRPASGRSLADLLTGGKDRNRGKANKGFL